MQLFLLILLFLILDMVYVSFVSSKYTLMINNIQQNTFKIRFVPAVLSYIVLVVALVFVVLPYAQLRKTVDKSMLKTAFFSGFLIGFAIYGVFNTTNLALFNNYSYSLAVLDVLWGASLFFLITLLFLFLSSPRVLFILKSSK